MFNSRLLAALVLLGFMLILDVDSCGFPMGGGGGGGGGCCCMGGGGGCGRKKRSVIEPQLRTEKDSPCPQSAWKEVMEEHVGQDADTSKYAVQSALFKTYENKFMVSCTQTEDKHHLQFVTNGEGFCTAGNENVWCAAILLQA